MIERSRTSFCIDVTNGGDGFVGRLAGDETGSELFEKAEPGGKLLEPFLTREVDQRASRKHSVRW